MTPRRAVSHDLHIGSPLQGIGSLHPRHGSYAATPDLLARAHVR